MRRALITGANGFIGAALAKKLRSIGVEVLGVDIQDGTDILMPGVIDYIVGEFKPETIFHLAGIATNRMADNDPGRCYAVNVGAAAMVLDAAYEHGANRVFIPTTPLPPIKHYGISKYLVGEVAKLHRLRDRITLVVHANVFGPGDRSSDRIVPAIIRSLLRGDEPRVNNCAKRAFIYIDDIVADYIRISMSPHAKPAQVVFPGETMSLANMALAIVEQVGGGHIRLVDEPDTADPSRHVGSGVIHDYKPKLLATVNWHRDNP